jgi:hypothetical protein
MFEGECARPASSRLSRCRIVQPPIEARHAITPRRTMDLHRQTLGNDSWDRLAVGA